MKGFVVGFWLGSAVMSAIVLWGLGQYPLPHVVLITQAGLKAGWNQWAMLTMMFSAPAVFAWMVFDSPAWSGICRGSRWLWARVVTAQVYRLRGWVRGRLRTREV